MVEEPNACLLNCLSSIENTVTSTITNNIGAKLNNLHEGEGSPRKETTVGYFFTVTVLGFKLNLVSYWNRHGLVC